VYFTSRTVFLGMTCTGDVGAYINFILWGMIKIFSLIQAQKLQVKFLVVFKSDESLIFVVFFFFNLMPDLLESTFV
jgi:hypothetical protein